MLNSNVCFNNKIFFSFFPSLPSSSNPAPATEKVGNDLEPRFLEDEGFYVGVKPAIAVKNKSKMENRLLKESEHTKTVRESELFKNFSI